MLCPKSKGIKSMIENDYDCVLIPVEGFGKIKVSRYKESVYIVLPKPTALLSLKPKEGVSIFEAFLKYSAELYIKNGISKEHLFTKINSIHDKLLQSLQSDSK